MTVTPSDLQILDRELIQGSFVDTFIEEIDWFNEASNGSIRFQNNIRGGKPEDTTFFKIDDDLIKVRDPNGTSPVPSSGITEDTTRPCREGWRHDPLQVTRSSAVLKATSGMRGGTDEWVETISTVYGNELARQLLRHRFRQGVGILVNTFLSVSDLIFDAEDLGGAAGSPASLTNAVDVFRQSKFLMGENWGAPGFAICPTEVVDALTTDLLANYQDLFEIEEIRSGLFGMQNRLRMPLMGLDIATSNQSVFYPNYPTKDEAFVLVLAPGALEVENSEEAVTWMDRLLGYENLMFAQQSEGGTAYRRPGFNWTGPDFAALFSQVTAAGNWEQKYSDSARLGGYVMRVDIS